MSRSPRMLSSFLSRVTLRSRLSWTRWLLSRLEKQEHRRLEMLALELQLQQTVQRLESVRERLRIPLRAATLPLEPPPPPLPEPEPQLEQLLPYLAEEPEEPMPDPLQEIRSLLPPLSSTSSAG